MNLKINFHFLALINAKHQVRQRHQFIHLVVFICIHIQFKNYISNLLLSKMAVNILKTTESSFKELCEYIEADDEKNLINFLNQFNNEEKLKILTTNYCGFNSLHLCCKYGNLGLLIFLLNFECLQQKGKLFIDLPTKDGDTCLLLGCLFFIIQIYTFL